LKNRSSRRATAVLTGSVISALALAATAQAGPSPAPPSASPTANQQPTTATPPDPVLRNLKAPEPIGTSKITTSSTDPTEQVDPLIGSTNAGNATQRADNNGQSAYIPGGVEDKLGQYFVTSVFSQPAAFTFGNTGRTLADGRHASHVHQRRAVAALLAL